MNEQKSALRAAVAYDADFFAWTADQALRLRAKKPAGLDWGNLAEEVEGLGKSDKRAVGSALKVVLEHLLKWQFQPEKRSSSWSDSIEEHRDRSRAFWKTARALLRFPGKFSNRNIVGRGARRFAIPGSRRIACRPPAPLRWTRFLIPTSGPNGRAKAAPAGKPIRRPRGTAGSAHQDARLHTIGQCRLYKG